MAENWLDQKAIDIINQPPNTTFNEPISIESSEEESDQTISRFYIKSKVNIQLPNTNRSEELQYIPPILPQNSSEENNSTEPHFVSQQEHFDIFEHFNYTWIPAPELEKK